VTHQQALCDLLKEVCFDAYRQVHRPHRTDATDRWNHFSSCIYSSFFQTGKERQYLGHDFFHGIGCI
jgi:cbb3-type cytochrome oxidase cytochrome c subunit